MQTFCVAHAPAPRVVCSNLTATTPLVGANVTLTSPPAPTPLAPPHPVPHCTTAQDDPRREPALSHQHIASDTDCIQSVAFQYGFTPEYLWNHAQNAELRDRRRNLNILFAGDEIHIPDLREQEYDRPTEQRHRFKRKSVAARIEFKVLRLGEPVANARYQLVIDGASTEGTTDGSGLVRAVIQANAQTGELRVDHEDGELVYPLDLGGMDPSDEVLGYQKRLSNLGYYVPPDDFGALTDQTRSAIALFQLDNGLSATGEPDDATIAKLVERTGH